MKESRANDILKNVVAQLKQLRKQRGLSHEALAKLAKVTRPAISHIENGNRKPSLLVCLRMAEAVGVSLAKIIAKAEKSN